jgi:Holliday junction resolvase RusA-like endonuclease
MQSDYIQITIPTLPPGINRTYQRTRSGIALTQAARSWDEDAALIVGSAAGQFDFEPDLAADYQIVIRWWGGRHDTDAHLKIVQDCVARKLNFDDRQISACVIERCPADYGEEDGETVGVLVYLFKALERDWITDLLKESDSAGVGYGDREGGGKYQGQTGITKARV